MADDTKLATGVGNAPAPPSPDLPPEMPPDVPPDMPPVENSSIGFVDATQQQIQPIPSPAFIPPKKQYTFEGFAKNQAKAAGQLLQGMYTMGSAMAQNVEEIYTPEGLIDPNLSNVLHDKTVAAVQNPTLENLYQAGKAASDFMIPKRLGIRSDVAQQDFQTLSTMGAAIVEDYKKRYGPALSGDLGNMLDQAYEGATLSYVGDILPLVGKVGKVGQLAHNLGMVPTAGKAGLGGFAAPGLTQSLPQAGLATRAFQSIPGVNNALEHFARQNAAWAAALAANQEFLRQLEPTLHRLQMAWDAIPTQYRPYVVVAGEQREMIRMPTIRNGQVVNGVDITTIPQIREFLDLAESIDRQIAPRLMQAGAFSNDAYMLAKWGPAARRYFRSQWDLATEPERLQMIDRLRQGYRVMGQREPTYFGIMWESEKRKALSLKGGIFNRQAGVGKLLQKQIQGNVESWQNPRTAEFQTGNRYRPGIATNAHDIIAAQYLRSMAYLALDDIIGNLMRNPHIQGTYPVNLRQALDGIMTNAGIRNNASFQQALASIPPTIHVTKEAQEIFNRLLALDQGGAAVAKDWMDGFTNWLKYISLGPNIHWSTGQLAQDILTAEYFMWKGPQDIARSVMAHRFAFDPAFEQGVRQAYPTLLGEVEHVDRVTDYLERLQDVFDNVGKYSHRTLNAQVMRPLAKILAFIPDQIEKNFNFVTASNNKVRLAYAAYNLMRQAELDNASSVALRDMFNLQARQLQVMDMLNYANVVEEMAQENWKILGRYDQLMATKHAGLRRVAMYGLWWIHSYSIFKSLPNSPFKTAALEKMLRVAPDAMQPALEGADYKKRGAVPILDLQGKWIMDPQGNRLVKFGSGFLPITQIPELISFLDYMANPADVEMQGPPPLNAAATLLMAYGLQVNPQTARGFSNPYAVGFAHKFDVRTGQQVRENQPMPVENWIPYAASPFYTKAIQRIKAFPYEPTDATTLWDKAPSRDVYGRKVRSPFNIPVIMGQILLHAKPGIMRSTSAQDTQRKMLIDREARRAVARGRLQGRVSNE